MWVTTLPKHGRHRLNVDWREAQHARSALSLKGYLSELNCPFVADVLFSFNLFNVADAASVEAPSDIVRL